jgi:hypothetical protein
MGKLLCIGSLISPGGADLSKDRLTAGVNVDVLDGEPFAAFPRSRFSASGSQGFSTALREVFMPSLECLLARHGAAIALHHCTVRS